MCSSLIDVDIIEWLNSDDEVIASLINISELTLTFALVNTSINNQMYTCRVSKGASVNKTITISVTGKKMIITMSYLIFICCNKQWKIF